MDTDAFNNEQANVYLPEVKRAESSKSRLNKKNTIHVDELIDTYKANKEKLCDILCSKAYRNLNTTDKGEFWKAIIGDDMFSLTLINIEKENKKVNDKTADKELDYLISHQCDTSITPKEMFKDAVKEQFVHIVQKMFETKKYVLDPDDTFLFDAFDNQDICTFGLLLENGHALDASKIINETNQTILHHIASSPNFEFANKVFKLIENNQLYDSSNSNGEIPLALAIHSRNLALFKEIIKHSNIFGDPDNKGRTVIHDAAIAGNMFLDLVLNMPSSDIIHIINHTDNLGQTALNQSNLSKESIEHLIGKGCDVLIPDNNGKTILHKVIEEAKKENIEFLSKNENAIKLITMQDNKRQNALHIAATLEIDTNDKAEIISTLLKKELPDEVFTTCDVNNQSPIEILIKKNEVEPFKVVMDFVKKRKLVFSNNQNIWHIIAKYNSEDIANSLNFYDKSKDNEENTPLHIAAQYDSQEVGNIIINKYIKLYPSEYDIKAMNKYNQTAAMLASINTILYRNLRCLDQTGGCNTEFYAAVKACDMARVRRSLMQKDFNFGFVYPCGLPIHAIAQYGTFEMMTLFLEKYSICISSIYKEKNVLEIAITHGNESVTLGFLNKIKENREEWAILIDNKSILDCASRANPLNETIFSAILDLDLASDAEKKSKDVIVSVIKSQNMNLFGKMKQFIEDDGRRAELLLESIPIGTDMFNAVLDGNEHPDAITTEVLHKAAECHNQEIINICLSKKGEPEQQINFFNSLLNEKSVVTDEFIRIYDSRLKDLNFLKFLINISSATVISATVGDQTLGEYISGDKLNDDLIFEFLNSNNSKRINENKVNLTTRMLTNLIRNNSKYAIMVTSMLANNGRWSADQELLLAAAEKLDLSTINDIVKEIIKVEPEIGQKLKEAVDNIGLSDRASLIDNIRLIFNPPQPEPEPAPQPEPEPAPQ